MDWMSAPQYTLARLLFVRGLAAIYVIAFLNVVAQWTPLLGERGLLPVPRFLNAVPARRAPSLFHWRYSDRLAVGLAWVGAGLSALVVAGIPSMGPVWLPMVAWAAIWVLYLSYVNVGQIWYGFGWESILLEAGFLAIFVAPQQVAPAALGIWLVRWLLFRVEFGAGLIKLRGDRCWRELTCLEYHHETQPIPNALSWSFHNLPRWMHKVEVGANFVTQLVVPFALFAPQPVPTVAAAVIIVTQGWLVLSGNFAWLNVLTMVLAFTGLSDAVVGHVLPAASEAIPATPVWLLGLVAAATLAVAVMSWQPVRNMLSRHQRMNAAYNPLHLVGSYGAFGSVTRTRYEIVVEGTEDAEPGPASTWQPFRFKGKPGDPRRRPPQVAPYHLRLDWLMWFAAMSSPHRHRWFLPLVEHLLTGDPQIRRLLADDPFDGRAPTAVRARRYRYAFTTRAQRRAVGAFWERELVDDYLPVVTRDTFVGTRG